jgi:hypothetical protein
MDGLINDRQFAGWIPIRFYWREGRPMVEWCHLGEQRFKESFFNQTVEKSLNDPFNLLFRQQTPIEVLDQWHEVRPGLRPTGFIFHLSRSGSTLISQLLAALPRNIVISEAPPIDAIVRAHFKSAEVTDEQRVTWLRSMLSALSQQRLREEQSFFVKFDAWHILELPLIRRAYPDVPWLFVYRDPVEVMVSQLDQRGQILPGILHYSLFGNDSHLLAEMGPAEYCARMLAAICQSALLHHQDGGMLINYRQLPEAVWSSMSEFFGTVWTESEIEIMKIATKTNSKNPAATFHDDSDAKRNKATEQVREAAGQWLYPVYEKLEAARLEGEQVD